MQMLGVEQKKSGAIGKKKKLLYKMLTKGETPKITGIVSKVRTGD